jgi:DNA-binding NarL/FixJ family response regulator
VLAGVTRGQSNAEIARSRACSPRTVANQLAAIFSSLRVRSRAELVRRAFGGELVP